MKNSTKKFIFDLDNTLYSPLQYSESLRADQFYRNLKPDRELTTLLKETKNNYIFTNGNKEHMDECLAKMKIKSLFKPQHTAYNELFGGRVPVYNELFAGRVPAYNELFAGRVPANDFFL